jgi:alpha-D-ribose 1-methylphosphonate 5-triphosphate synthase subunit PhnL
MTMDRSVDPLADRVLSVRGLHKHFLIHAIGRHVDALKGVDISVGAGEHVALIGASGAGKSTLLRCIWRSYRPSSGEIWLRQRDGTSTDLGAADDRVVADVRRVEIGYVGQFLRAEPRRSVLEVVTRAGIRRGAPPAAAAEQAADVLRAVSIGEELWATSPVVLSGGEQQRVNLAAGTLFPPRLLLLDEPVASLDARNRDQVLARVGQLAEDGVAVLSVFHDLEAVRLLATRVIALSDGEVVADGSPAEVLDGLAA